MIIKLPWKKINKTDEEMIRLFSASGDLEVLGELYSRYMHLVYGVSLKYLKDRDISKDAVMQIFEKLINEIPKQKIGNFRSWLYVVTRNYCLMELRSQKNTDQKHKEWITDPGSFMENGFVLHPIDEDEIDYGKALEDCIKKLNDEQKNCIMKFYYDNKCYREISEELQIDEKKVKSHLQNGKRNLKLCLENKNETKD